MENTQHSTEDIDDIIKQQEEAFMNGAKNGGNIKKKAKVERGGKKFDSANHELQKHREKQS